MFRSRNARIFGFMSERDAIVDEVTERVVEELVAAAFKNAFEKAKDLESREMGKLTGGLNLPGLSF